MESNKNHETNHPKIWVAKLLKISFPSWVFYNSPSPFFRSHAAKKKGGCNARQALLKVGIQFQSFTSLFSLSLSFYPSFFLSPCAKSACACVYCNCDCKIYICNALRSKKKKKIPLNHFPLGKKKEINLLIRLQFTQGKKGGKNVPMKGNQFSIETWLFALHILNGVFHSLHHFDRFIPLLLLFLLFSLSSHIYLKFLIFIYYSRKSV